MAVVLPVATVNTATTTFSQPITCTNIDASDNLVGIQGDFTFDETIVTFQSPPVSAAGLTSTNWNVAANVLPGGGPIRTLRISAFSNDGVTPLSGSGTLLLLNMTRVSSTPGASTPLTWAASPNDFEFINTDIDVRIPNSTPAGSITIVAAPTPTATPTAAPTATPTVAPTATPTASPTASPSPTPTPPPVISISGTATYCSNPSLNPVPGVIMTLSGGASGSTATDGSGNYTFAGLASGGNYTVTPTKTALAAGSTGISTQDVLAVQRHFLGITIIPAGCRLTAADVNGDTNVNTTDVVGVQRFFLGFTSGIANVGKYSFSPANRTYPAVSSNQTGQNYDVIVFGDVASSYVHRPSGPSQDATDGAPEIPPTVAIVSLPEVAVDRSKTNNVARVMSSMIDSANNLVGFQGDFTFDERVITFAQNPVQKAGLTSGNWNVSGNVLPGVGPMRTLRISAYSTDFKPLSGEGTLFQLNMRKVSKTGQSTPLIWATPPNGFIFIDADLNMQRPGTAPAGSVAIKR